MPRILCIVTSSEDRFAEMMISAQQAQPNCSVEVHELRQTSDYDKLLDAIFAADSVQVW